MAQLPRSTQRIESAHPASPSVASELTLPADARCATFGVRLARWVRTEPRWLRGVTWRLIGMVVAIAAMQNVPELFSVIVPRHRGDNDSWHSALFDLTSQLIAGLSIMLIATWLLNLKWYRIPKPLALFIAVLGGSALTFNLIGYVCFGDAKALLFANSDARRVALPWALAAAAWYFLQRADVKQAALREATVMQQRLQTDVMEARLQALQAQVEPHFLFNTLAHVRRLYRTDPASARRMLDSFRIYLQSALPQIRGRAVTLGHELDLVRAYLDVQQVRMGERLRVSMDVAADLSASEFPSMMLICLVENAIKHGLSPLAQGGAIHITATRTVASLEVCVADNGRGIGDAMGSGTGLANVRGRLAALYGASGQLRLLSNAPRGVRALLTLPLHTKPSAMTTEAAPAAMTP